MGLCSVKFKKTLLNVCAILVPVLSIGAAAMNKDPFPPKGAHSPVTETVSATWHVVSTLVHVWYLCV